MTLEAALWILPLVSVLSVAGLSFCLRAVYAGRNTPLRIGPYRVREQIGHGGTGVVYRATDVRRGQPVALKVLAAPARSNAARRFESEVAALSRVKHPHVVQLIDSSARRDANGYLALELLDGLDLERLVKVAGALPPARVLRILVQICSALAAAHEQGIVHRDLKPANVVLCRGPEPDWVKLIDFGLARQTSVELDATEQRAVIGTPYNMAPETFLDPSAAGVPADLYGIGTIAYTLLSGQPVFTGKTLVEVAIKHLHEEPTSIAEQCPFGISTELAEIVTWCLAKDPALRPPSAQALQHALMSCPEAARPSPRARVIAAAQVVDPPLQEVA